MELDVVEHAGRSRHATGRHAAAALLALVVGTAGAAAGATTLEEAVKTALDTNPAVSGAEAERRAAREDIKEARAGYFPSVDVAGEVTRERSNIKQLRRTGADDRYLTARQFGVTVRQMVFDGLATPNEVARRRALLDAASGRAADTRESIAFSAANAFLDVLRARRLVKVGTDSVAFHRDTLERVDLRVRRGISRRADVQQARARLALAMSTLTAREGALREANLAYRRVVGEFPADLSEPDPRATAIVVDGAVDQTRLLNAVDEATGTAIAENPALQAAKAEVEASEAELRLARTGYMPRVDIELNVNRDGNLAGVEGTRNVDSVGLVTSWNLFRGGADRAREKAAAERQVAAMDSAAETRRAIEEAVGTAVQAKATSEERLVHLRAHLDAAQSTLASYEAQLRLGRRTLLDMLNAANEVFTARSNLESGRFDDLVNQYFVDAAKGVLVDSLGMAPTEQR